MFVEGKKMRGTPGQRSGEVTFTVGQRHPRLGSKKGDFIPSLSVLTPQEDSSFSNSTFGGLESYFWEVDTQAQHSKRCQNRAGHTLGYQRPALLTSLLCLPPQKPPSLDDLGPSSTPLPWKGEDNQRQG